jgi:hypothetical protein
MQNSVSVLCRFLVPSMFRRVYSGYAQGPGPPGPVFLRRGTPGNEPWDMRTLPGRALTDRRPRRVRGYNLAQLGPL